MQTLTIDREINFGYHGGTEYFFHDIDNDGSLEIISYQGPAVLGAGMYRKHSCIGDYLPDSTSVSAFRLNGERMWTWGEPHNSDIPYLSHSYEAVVAAADIDGDDLCEIIVADGDRVAVLDGTKGTVKSIVPLEQDNFYIVQAVNGPLQSNEAVIVLKNGEGGYGDWEYGEPVIGLNSKCERVWGPAKIPGAGHHILALDLDHDGKKEYLIGYSLVKADGSVIWTVEGIDPEKLRQLPQHVDYTSIYSDRDGHFILAIAGSDRLWLVNESGKTIFSVPDKHVQGAAIGHFRDDSEYQAALYNAPDGPMALFDPQGREQWRKDTPREWPMGKAACIMGECRQPFHRNRPIVTIRGDAQDWIAYADGGWPWAMDGEGNISLRFEAPENSVKPECKHKLPWELRRDDLGFSYALRSLDIFGEEKERIIIYDRQHMWIYGGV